MKKRRRERNKKERKERAEKLNILVGQLIKKFFPTYRVKVFKETIGFPDLLIEDDVGNKIPIEVKERSGGKVKIERYEWGKCGYTIRWYPPPWELIGEGAFIREPEIYFFTHQIDGNLTHKNYEYLLFVVYGCKVEPQSPSYVKTPYGYLVLTELQHLEQALYLIKDLVKVNLQTQPL
jgi:hypothetical protein